MLCVSLQEVDKDAGHSTSIGSSPNHKPLNRFANITVCKSALQLSSPLPDFLPSPPDDDNRIILRPIEGHSDCQRDFINACYVDVCCFLCSCVGGVTPCSVCV